jgi:hypothetical protein
VLAYFGYPKAHEDDAERAVRAGLASTGKVANLSTGGRKLSARIGIATGHVVVGDPIGEGAAQEEAVVGETPNLAARLEALAAPGSVVIAPGTRRLIGDLFEVADLGAHALKGFGEPVRAWRVVGAGVAESRFDALRGRHPIPLVGREEELHLLLARWRRAADSEGQVVLLPAKPGSANREFSRRSASGSPDSRTLPSAMIARPTTAQARSIRSSASWSAPPASPGTTRPRPNWTSSKLFSPRGHRALGNHVFRWEKDCRTPVWHYIWC